MNSSTRGDQVVTDRTRHAHVASGNARVVADTSTQIDFSAGGDDVRRHVALEMQLPARDDGITVDGCIEIHLAAGQIQIIVHGTALDHHVTEFLCVGRGSQQCGSNCGGNEQLKGTLKNIHAVILGGGL